MRTVSLVGSTGSIGTQAIDVVETDPDRFRVVALAAQRSVDQLVEQARRLRPELVVIGDPALVPEVAAQLPPSVEVMGGAEGLEAAGTAADVIVNGVVGFAGLPVTLAALKGGRRLALANKESLIAGAPVVQAARQTPGAHIVPVDSEHCAIHQCLVATSVGRPGSSAGSADPDGVDPDRAEPNGDGVRRLLVTASGGPFRGRSRDELRVIGVDDALAHPTWRMGRKITIDSSTLMNKGLEVIEAHELFGVPYDRIDVVVHPQSIVHSMVELFDGTTIAQLSQPDMRLPIGYAMGWPERLATPFGAIDWSGAFSLAFEPPDRSVFTCLDLAYRAGRRGGAAPAWLNAANEVAVAAFLEGRLGWLGIAEVVEDVLDGCTDGPMASAGDVLEADRQARERAGTAVERRLAAA
ncbi:MAG TPA: 1-deoxy-D-xylulose-5-phosphate reductoisomerase [Acidimicrobiales bacterium]|jgi:1-deoxy-D-xylulose-5-phosphate reductoisomerase|nr:1-deoxy-D-xylulose-5-phosphate reductoisomerase [Acidimicrobiales bacterium]